MDKTAEYFTVFDRPEMLPFRFGICIFIAVNINLSQSICKGEDSNETAETGTESSAVDQDETVGSNPAE